MLCLEVTTIYLDTHDLVGERLELGLELFHGCGPLVAALIAAVRAAARADIRGIESELAHAHALDVNWLAAGASLTSRVRVAGEVVITEESISLARRLDATLAELGVVASSAAAMLTACLWRVVLVLSHAIHLRSKLCLHTEIVNWG